MLGRKQIRYLGALPLGLLVLSGCQDGGGSTPTEPTPPGDVVVTLAPASVLLDPGGSQQFAATVIGGDDTEVTWRVAGGQNRGSVSGEGLYGAPSTTPWPRSVTVEAASREDTSAVGRATVRFPEPDFALEDVNPNSATYAQPISPRGQRGAISAWYFGSAT